jgi:cobalt/nickel transport system ATP-binding protein
MIELNAIGYGYESDEEVLRGISFSIGQHEKAVLVGANGSGKTTLLKLIDGLLFPREGTYRYKGQAVTQAALREPDFRRQFRREVVLLFQNPDVMLFNPTVYDEIAFGPRQFDLSDVDDRVHTWARKMNIEKLLQRPPFHLSAGEKQRVCLAALLVLEPEVVLFDEPTASLDPRTTGWLIDFLQDLSLTTVVKTHNLSLAAELGGRTLALSEDHRLILDGTINTLIQDEEVLREANLLHTHQHRHGEAEHRHLHRHDWD